MIQLLLARLLSAVHFYKLFLHPDVFHLLCFLLMQKFKSNFGFFVFSSLCRSPDSHFKTVFLLLFYCFCFYCRLFSRVSFFLKAVVLFLDYSFVFFSFVSPDVWVCSFRAEINFCVFIVMNEDQVLTWKADFCFRLVSFTGHCRDSKVRLRAPPAVHIQKSKLSPSLYSLDFSW